MLEFEKYNLGAHGQTYVRKEYLPVEELSTSRTSEPSDYSSRHIKPILTKYRERRKYMEI